MIKEKIHIFIIDDDESICRSLKILLMTYGFEVSTFLSAEDYFSSGQIIAPDCLILDIHLPGLNGWEALRRFIKANSKCPVIMISVEVTQGNTKRALQAGATGYLQKPFTDQALIDLISSAVNRKEKDK